MRPASPPASELVLHYAFSPVVDRAASASWRVYIKHPLLLRRISELRVPVLALYGSNDVRPSWPIQQLAHLLPNAHYEVITEAGHCPWLTHADDMRSHIRAFLHGLPA